jgi:hypothetical protein
VGPSPPFVFLPPVTRMVTRVNTAIVVLVILSACTGGLGDKATPVAISLEYHESAGAIVIQVDTHGGLVRPPSGRHVPELTIYGDGLVVLAEDDGAPRVGTDRRVTTGHIDKEKTQELVAFIAESGFFGLDDQYAPSPLLPDMPWRYVTANLLSTSKTVSIYPHDFEQAPKALLETYRMLMGLSPADAMVFTPSSGTLSATDLGPIEELPGGRQSQVAPWDTPLVGIALSEVTEGIHLEGEQYQVVEEYLLRYPRGQLFGSQEGIAYQVLMEADLPWEAGSP